ncbi:hypothetical protein VTL71DRAFT_4662 [Oculimacula yallundae]|uniref:Uncharacterized protein n=1 Tax=Oculimacula yallundae TaxID=86028 RepID=A0ABR4C2I6_9HELO
MARLSVAILWLFSQVAAQKYPSFAATVTVTASDSAATNPSSTVTVTRTRPTVTSQQGPVTSSFSQITGPFIAAFSSTWSQFIIPITVGTVMITINEATNQTYSTTIYHTDFESNGSTSLLTRTDTNAAGTITQVATYGFNQTTTITYPTNLFEVDDSLRWEAILPTYINNATCCFDVPTFSPTPTHTPFVEVGDLNTQDPRGWLYTLVGFNLGDSYTKFESDEVSSLFTGQQLSIPYSGCPYTYCNYSTAVPSAASGVDAQPAGIFATSTTTISILPDDDVPTSVPALSDIAPPTPTQAPTTDAGQVNSPTTQPAIPPTTPAEAQAPTTDAGAVDAPSSQQANPPTTPVEQQPTVSSTTPQQPSSPSTVEPLVSAPASQSTQIPGAPPQVSNPGNSSPARQPSTSTSSPPVPTSEPTISVMSGETATILPQTTGIGGIINSIMGGVPDGTTSPTSEASAGSTGLSNSTAAPTYVQASGVDRLWPTWLGIVFPVVLYLMTSV